MSQPGTRDQPASSGIFGTLSLRHLRTHAYNISSRTGWRSRSCRSISFPASARMIARAPARSRSSGSSGGGDPHRAGARGGGAELHARGGLRQGRALCRASASPRATVAAAAPGRGKGRRAGGFRADLLGRGARRGRRALDTRGPAPRLGGGVAALLRRDDGPSAARRHPAAAPRDALFARSIRRSAAR